MGPSTPDIEGGEESNEMPEKLPTANDGGACLDLRCALPPRLVLATDAPGRGMLSLGRNGCTCPGTDANDGACVLISCGWGPTLFGFLAINSAPELATSSAFIAYQ